MRIKALDSRYVGRPNEYKSDRKKSGVVPVALRQVECVSGITGDYGDSALISPSIFAGQQQPSVQVKCTVTVIVIYAS